MRLNRTLAGAVAGLAGLGVATAFAAPPDAETLTLTCGDSTYEVWVNGVGDWTPGHVVGGGTLIPYYFDDSGTYTPPGGGAPEPFADFSSKGNGNASKSRDLTPCSLDYSFFDPETGEAFEGTSEVGVVLRGAR